MADLPVSILDCCHEPKLFSPWFTDRRSWQNWFVVLKAIFGLTLMRHQREVFKRLTGRNSPPKKQPKYVWLIVGRRGGKSLILALIAVYLACFRDWRPYLQPGEMGTIMLIAKDRDQARIIFRYISALILKVPLLKKRLLRAPSGDRIALKGSVEIEVHTCSFRSTRGYTIIAALLDEVAFWRSDDSANPDTEIIRALRPGMATIPGALLIAASSPYARRGVLWQAYRDYWGKDSDRVLVVKAPTITMHPSIDSGEIQDAYAEDPASAAAEYGAEFRTDVESFVPQEIIDDVTVTGRRELAPIEGIRYYGFCDPSGGTQDDFCLAIGHRDGDLSILDCVRKVTPPLDPDVVIADFSKTLLEYGVRHIKGDAYAGQWPSLRFAKHGVFYEQVGIFKNELYRDLLPVLNTGRVELLDIPELRQQLCGLERRTTRGGRDTIDHPPGAKDDVANVVAGLITIMSPKGLAWSEEGIHIGPALKSSEADALYISEDTGSYEAA